ncbi:hypothetical protein AZI87_13820 [Bdellovibrio bacteriovorus]|uniref:Outer membrane protein beta-barrel domain-containing protein n=1 Tax=Bdellovibrio bacteriovorus TaxID=959 RepID=A0A150WBU4_BDEBC|nr:hypothetical protein [Bdellovibrio bacteriovorus]KYG60358.1 hypothetical protein AZI85_12860 [Bdellovibrio bacteriovorus]KYG64308.1 hypothetical protein AZI87_13820 [Bdellovibrio bacteriovorus]
MKKYFYILAALSIAPTYSLAQSLESDVDAELDQMYSSQQAAPAAASAPQAGIANTAPVSGQPIYILNQATPTSNAQLQQSQIQKQPTTVIEASPLTESRAEQIRRARQDAELQTEQRIVEKLEHSRMEDEKKRAGVLFGDKFNQLDQSQQQPQQQYQQPVAVQPVQVQQVQEPKENTRDIVREEIAAAMKVEEEAPLAPLETKYVAGILGIGDYPDTRQVKGNYALGVAFGTKYDNFIVEGSFLYSNYTVEGQGYYTGNYGYGYGYPYSGGTYIPDTIDVQQYTGSLAAKVQLFSGIIKPVFGGVVAYSYRGYSWDNKNPYGYVNDTKANSHAIDIGTVVGADLEFSPKYSLGVDFRYMWNLSSRVNADDNTWISRPEYSNSLEKLQYYVMSLVGRVNF